MSLAMASEVGRIDLGLNINKKTFDAELGSIASHATMQSKKMFSGLGLAMGGAIGGGLGVAMAGINGAKRLIDKAFDFGASAIDIGSDISEVQNVVDVTFGGMSKSIDTWSDKALEAFGLSELSAKKYSSNMGAMLKSTGITGDKMLEMSTSLTGLSADLASFFNMSNDEAWNKVKTIATGETEPFKAIGVNMSVASLEAFRLAQGMDKAYDKMNQAEKIMLRYQYVMSVTSDAQGDFARTSDGWANQTRILAENMNKLKGEIGEGLIVLLKPALVSLNNFIKKLQEGAAYFKAFANLLSGKAGIGADQVDQTAKANTGLANSVDNVGDAVSGAGKKIKGALGSFDQLNTLSMASGEVISSAAEELSNEMNNVSFGDDSLSLDIEMDTQGVDEKVQAFYQSFMNSIAPLVKPAEELKDAVKGLFDEFRGIGSTDEYDWILDILTSLAGFNMSQISGNVKLFTAHIQQWKAILSGDFLNAEYIETYFDSIYSYFLGFVQLFTPDEVDSQLEDLQERFKTLWQGLKSDMITYNDPTKLEYTDFIDYFNDEFSKKLKDVLPSSFVEMIIDIRDKVKSKFAEVGEKFTKGYQYIIDERDRILDPFETYFRTMFNEVKNVIINKLDEWKTKAGDKWDEFTDKFNGETLKDDLEELWEDITDDFDNVFPGLEDTATTVINNIIDLINGLSEKWNKLEFGMPDINAFGIEVEGFSIAVPQIPEIEKINQSPSLNSITPKGPISNSSLHDLNTTPGAQSKKSGYNHTGLGGYQVPEFASGALVNGPTLAIVGDNQNASVDPEVISPLSKLQELMNSKDQMIVDVLYLILEAIRTQNFGVTIGETEFGKVADQAISKYKRLVGV